MARSPIDRMIDTASFRCLKCGAARETCDCWTVCHCGWTFETGKTCTNSAHDSARVMADSVVHDTLAEMKAHYPVPLRHASGGFRRTLKAHIQRESYNQILAWLMNQYNDDTGPARIASFNVKTEMRRLYPVPMATPGFSEMLARLVNELVQEWIDQMLEHRKKAESK